MSDDPATWQAIVRCTSRLGDAHCHRTLGHRGEHRGWVDDHKLLWETIEVRPVKDSRA